MSEIVCEKNAKANTNSVELKFAKLSEQVRKYFVNPKCENEGFGWYVNYIICSLDFRNTEAVIH